MELSEKAMAPHSSTLAWKLSWTGGAWWAAVYGVATSQTRLHLHFSLSHIGEGNDSPLKCSCLRIPGESQGRGSLVGCHLWGRIESDTTEVT